ncbi:hypothetical protein OPT61_g2801 [Boeremia exigua]|uniref:Uncharacterized protein n=1 Tax=Boeremia exigua TaxID=749465 RepID=A0ACC2IK91_9PLEO|nr:hypothetical protein OPT61_g2801 [Boeremia exigua]
MQHSSGIAEIVLSVKTDAAAGITCESNGTLSPGGSAIGRKPGVGKCEKPNLTLSLGSRHQTILVNTMSSNTYCDSRVPYEDCYNFVDSPSIHVLVGSCDEKKQFVVHEDLIKRSSPFFANAMGRDWKESCERTVPLPDDEPAVFSLYLKRIYTGTLPIQMPATNTTGEQDQYHALSKLYVLAEKLMDVDTKKAVLAALSARAVETSYVTLPGCDSISYIYEGTPENDAARQWLVDVYTNYGSGNIMDCDRTGYPKEFLADLAVSMMKERAQPRVYKETEDRLAQTEATLKRTAEDLVSMRSRADTSERALKKVKCSHSDEKYLLQNKLLFAESETEQLRN